MDSKNVNLNSAVDPPEVLDSSSKPQVQSIKFPESRIDAAEGSSKNIIVSNSTPNSPAKRTIVFNGIESE